MSRVRLLRICRCNTVVKGHDPCPNCHSAEAKNNDKQTIYVDGPTHMFTDDKMFPVDHNDPMKRRIVPNKRAYQEHIARSDGKLEAIG